MQTPTPDQHARAELHEGVDSLGDSTASINFEESADADEVMRMLEQGPPKKDSGTCGVRTPRGVAPALTMQPRQARGRTRPAPR